jgi:biopolymer transport protein ExbB
MRLRKLLRGTLFALTLCAASSLAHAAQEVDPHDAPKKSWLELFKTTGIVGYLMLGCSVIGTTLVIEHMVSLRREKLAPTPLAEDLEALINEEQYDEAVELCDEEGGYLASVVGAALHMRHAGYEEMVQSLETAANEKAFELNTKISYLSLIGNVAPLLGLLGTVTGMISSFQVIETLKAPTPGDLAKGVYESLVNTTLGLFIAILFLTIYFFFKNKVSKMTLSMNLQAVDLLRHLAIQKRELA